LNYAQSSITAQIQALEDELGVPLFDRLGRRVVLTDAGKTLLDYATQILDLADEARAAVGGEGAVTGSLTISATESLFSYRLPPVLHAFQKRFPNYRLTLRPTRFDRLHQAVYEGKLDIAFTMEQPVQSTRLEVVPLINEPLLVLAPPGHRLIECAQVMPDDLEDEPVILTEMGCNYRNLFERQLTAAGVLPATMLEFNSIEAIKQCVKVGMGISVLPAMTVQQEIADGSLVALNWGIPNFEVVTCMAWHGDKWLSPAMTAFIDLSREILQVRVEG
jgi:DNA-binding transcriptional LysR family regulator